MSATSHAEAGSSVTTVAFNFAHILSLSGAARRAPAATLGEVSPHTSTFPFPAGCRDVWDRFLYKF